MPKEKIDDLNAKSAQELGKAVKKQLRGETRYKGGTKSTYRDFHQFIRSLRLVLNDDSKELDDDSRHQ